MYTSPLFDPYQRRLDGFHTRGGALNREDLLSFPRASEHLGRESEGKQRARVRVGWAWLGEARRPR